MRWPPPDLPRFEWRFSPLHKRNLRWPHIYAISFSLIGGTLHRQYWDDPRWWPYAQRWRASRDGVFGPWRRYAAEAKCDLRTMGEAAT